MYVCIYNYLLNVFNYFWLNYLCVYLLTYWNLIIFFFLLTNKFTSVFPDGRHRVVNVTMTCHRSCLSCDRETTFFLRKPTSLPSEPVCRCTCALCSTTCPLRTRPRPVRRRGLLSAEGTFFRWWARRTPPGGRRRGSATVTCAPPSSLLHSSRRGRGTFQNSQWPIVSCLTSFTIYTCLFVCQAAQVPDENRLLPQSRSL